MATKQEHSHGIDSPTALTLTLAEIEKSGMTVEDYVIGAIKDAASKLPRTTYHVFGIDTNAPFCGNGDIDVYMENHEGLFIYYIGQTLSVEHGSPVSGGTHIISDERRAEIATKISKFIGTAVEPSDLREYIIVG